jgi:hypothetical protein
VKPAAATAPSADAARHSLSAVGKPLTTQTTDFLALVQDYNAKLASAAASDSRSAAADTINEHSSLLSSSSSSAASAEDQSQQPSRSSTSPAASSSASSIPLSPDYYLHSLYPREMYALPVVAHDSDAVVGNAGAALPSSAPAIPTAQAAASVTVATTRAAAAATSLSSSASASAESTTLTPEEAYSFSRGLQVNQYLLVSMSLCALYLGILHPFTHDPTGILLTAGEHMSFTSVSQTQHDVSLGTWHTPAYSIAFHYCLLVFGYGWRGVAARNVMFLQFVTVQPLILALVMFVFFLLNCCGCFSPE